MATKKTSTKESASQELSGKRQAVKGSTSRERVFKLVHGQLEDFKNPENAVTTELNRPEVGEVLNLSISFTVGYGNMVAVGILYESAMSENLSRPTTKPA
jgi:hypothetical protein